MGCLQQKKLKLGSFRQKSRDFLNTLHGVLRSMPAKQRSRITSDSLGNEQVEVRLSSDNQHLVSLRVVVDDNLVLVSKLYQGVDGAIRVAKDNGTIVKLSRDTEGSY